MSGLQPFDVLYESDGARFQLPAELERVYGGLGFESPVLFSNFVSSVDGVVAVGSVPSSGSLISGRNAADRFLMGLLRACADAVLIGAGTLRATPGHMWTPEHVAPDFAAGFSDLRRTLGLDPQPRLVVVTSSGDFDTSHPALRAGATIVAPSGEAGAVRRRLPESCDVIEAGPAHHVDVTRAVEELHSRGWNRVLTEGGPHLIGQLLKGSLLDEIFLTVSPVIAGRNGDDRLGMVAGAELLPSEGRWSSLLSARRHGDFLFLRYGLATGG